MNPPRLRAALPLCAVALSLSASAIAADGGNAGHKLGDHPAVVIQRLQRLAGYDYASKFYPHPAWLRLYASPPPELSPPNVAQAAATDPAVAEIAAR